MGMSIAINLKRFLIEFDHSIAVSGLVNSLI